MEWDFSHARNINKQGMIMTFLGCGREKKYRKMMAKAQSKIDGELDLVKFIHSKRVNTYTALALMNGRQQYVADKLSGMIIRESSDLDSGTSEDFELEQENVDDVE